MIKYIGSKRVLLPQISRIVRAIPRATSVLDLFSGTSRVGHALKSRGFRVIANDYAAYAHALATCYVQADAEEWRERAERLVTELQEVRSQAGYFTRTFCEEARFFTPENGARVDAIRDEIARRDLPAELEAIALVSLMEAADRVDSTTGVQMAYLKRWAPRAANPLALRVPRLLPRPAAGRCAAHRMDARVAARTLGADVAYVDPPYNQHSYLGNYHVWETLVRWDAPEAYGIARKRSDVRTRRSDFNSKRRHAGAMRELVESIDATVLVVSFSDEGYLDRDELVEMLSTRGEVLVFEFDFRRYVGAQIGIHDHRGVKVGRVSHLRNREMIFVAGPAASLDPLRDLEPDALALATPT
ncbi:MAG TPA: DNA adenine methylase [Gemmatimonadales bacterium]